MTIPLTGTWGSEQRMASAAEMSGRIDSPAMRGFSRRDLLRLLFYYKYPALTAFLIPFTLGLIFAALSHPTFLAEARLLVLPSGEYMYRPQVGQPVPEIAFDRTQIVQSEIQVLQDSKLRVKTLQAIGPDLVLGEFNPARPNAWARAVTDMDRTLSISAVPLSTAINLTYRNRDPVVAADVLNKLIALYLQERYVVFQRSPTGELTEQRDQFADRLHKAELALIQFGEQHHITDPDAQLGILLRQQADVGNQQREVTQRISTIIAQTDQISSQLAKTPPTIELYAERVRTLGADTRSQDLARLEIQRQDMTKRYQEDSPQVQDLDRRLTALRHETAATSGADLGRARSGRNPLYDDLAAQLARLQAEQSGLEADRSTLKETAVAMQARLEELNNAAQQYRMMKRDRDVLEDIYRSFSRNAEEAQLNNALDRTRYANVRVIQAASPPPTGSSLRLALLGAGAALGIISAVAMLALLSALREVIIDPSDAMRKLRLPVLLAVPLHQSENGKLPEQRRARQRRRAQDARPALT